MKMGQTCFVKMEVIEQMCDALLKLKYDPELRKEFKENRIKFFKEEMDLEKM
ncbi:MAG TPA: glycosyltransferase family 4 protein [Candidatus Methanofastidiosum sp.]|nr:glycosyltransferase family 4 protein [Methanofastidiosum sp.]